MHVVRKAVSASRGVRWRLALAFTALCAVLLARSAPAEAQGLPLIRDTEIETLLNDYAQPIFKAAGLGTQRVAVRIVRNDAFNAFVLDGRNVFVHTGMLMQADTPNQVIGVIAHEAGHITGGHVAAMQARLAREQTRMLLLRVLGIGAAIVSGRGEAIVAADEVVIRSFLAERRSQESAADQAGLSFLSATKQSGRGMLETFERFAQQEYVSDAYKDPFVRSHPVAVDRLRQLRDGVEKSPFYAQKDFRRFTTPARPDAGEARRLPEPAAGRREPLSRRRQLAAGALCSRHRQVLPRRTGRARGGPRRRRGTDTRTPDLSLLPRVEG